MIEQPGKTYSGAVLMRYRLLLGFLSVAALLGLNPYVYGVFNHYVTLPFYYDLVNPQLFPGDELVAERAYFYTWFLKGLAAIGKFTGLSAPLLFFLVHAISVIASVYTFFGMGCALWGRLEPALYGTVLFLFGVKVLGGVSTFESLLMERTLVLPLEFLALTYCLQGHWIRSLALVGLAFLFHPLSAFYVGVMIGCAGLYGLLSGDRSLDLKTFIFGLLAGAIIASPSIYLKLVSEAPTQPALSAEAGWLEILAIRSSDHVFPSTWGIAGFLLSFIFLFGFFRNAAGFLPEEKHRRILAAAGAGVLLAILGTLFSEVVPASLPIQFQFWRSFRFLVYFGFLYAGWRLWRTVEGEYSFGDGLVTVVLVLALWGEAELQKLIGVAAVLLCIHPFFSYATAMLAWGASKREGVLVALVLGLAALGLSERGFYVQSAQEPEWRAAQRWAAESTPISAVFVVPPDRLGFRVESQRAIYGDWNDGTQNFFNHKFGEAWYHRMNMLGFDGNPDALGRTYRQVSAEGFQKISAEIRETREELVEVYAVLYHNQKLESESFHQVFENSQYRIVQISGSAGE